MNENEVLGWLVGLARRQAATQDMLGLICLNLSVKNSDAAATLQVLMQRTQSPQELMPTTELRELAKFLGECLDGRSDPTFLSLQPLRPQRSTRQELRDLLRVIPGGAPAAD